MQYDAFYVKAELRACLAVVIVCGIPFFLLHTILSPLNDRVHVSTIVLLSCVAFVFLCTIGYPLYRSYVDPPTVDVETPAHIEDLRKLLESREVRPTSGCLALHLDFCLLNVALRYSSANGLSAAQRSLRHVGDRDCANVGPWKRMYCQVGGLPQQQLGGVHKSNPRAGSQGGW